MLTRICLALALPMLVGQNGPPTSWRTFAYPNLGFSVALPSAPKEKKQRLTLPSGDLEVTLFTFEGVAEGTLVVVVTQFPSSAIEGGEEKRLKNARDGAVENAKGKLLHDRKIVVQGHPGRELWIETANSNVIHARLIAVPNRLYQMMAIGTKSFVETKEEVKWFMDSFKVKK